MKYFKQISLAVLYGIGNGTLFYIIGGVAQPVFATITPEVAAVLGFVTAAGIAMAKAIDNDEE